MHPLDERPAFLLPITTENDRRGKVVSIYADKVWRINDTKIIRAILENLYEDAYSAGLKDMDRMHTETDKTLNDLT